MTYIIIYIYIHTQYNESLKWSKMKTSCFPGCTAKTSRFQGKHRVFPGWLYKRCFHDWALLKQTRYTNQPITYHSHIIVAWYDHLLAFLLVQVLWKNCLKCGDGCTPPNIDLIEGLVWDLDWNFRQLLRKVRVYFDPVQNPCFTRANPNFWYN